MAKTHYVNDGRSLCGWPAIRYDSAGHMVSSLRVSKDPDAVNCIKCWRKSADGRGGGSRVGSR